MVNILKKFFFCSSFFSFSKNQFWQLDTKFELRVTFWGKEDTSHMAHVPHFEGMTQETQKQNQFSGC